jgi:ABC-type transporter Mla MlaB component
MSIVSPQTPATLTRDHLLCELVERVMSPARIRPRLYGDLTTRRALAIAFQTLQQLCREAQVSEVDLDLREVTAATPALFTMLRRLDVELTDLGGRLRIRGVSDAVLLAMDDPAMSLADAVMMYRCAHDVYVVVDAGTPDPDDVIAG